MKTHPNMCRNCKFCVHTHELAGTPPSCMPKAKIECKRFPTTTKHEPTDYCGEYEFKIKTKIKTKDTILVEFKSPIRTGMSLALGFFLMSIVLWIIGWVVFAGSCAAILSR